MEKITDKDIYTNNIVDFIDMKESKKYLRSQIFEIEINAMETLYVPDVWVEDNPICPIHNTRLSEYPYVIAGEKRIAFKGFICNQCNKILVRRTVALDIKDKCQEHGINCPIIKPIRPEIKKAKVIKKRPQYMIENGKRFEFSYGGEMNNNTYILTEENTVVISNTNYCYLEGHETEQVDAVYIVSEKRKGKKTYLSLLGYCSQCQKFYMNELDYKVIYSYGRPEFVVIRDVEEDEYLVTSGEVYNLEKEHLQGVEGDIGKEIHRIKESGDYVSQTETASDYDEIAALQYRKSISREKYEPLLEELYQMGDVPYRYRVDIVFANKTETYYIGAKDIILDGEKKVISMASNMGRTLVNARTTHYIKDGMQYDVKLSREFDIKKAYLYGYKNIKMDEDAVFRAGITDPFLIRVLNQRKRQHDLVDIFVTIQENQNTIVDERLDKNIIVQGCAGSGKTMVMLHRLYTLKYNHPEFDFSNNALILTPNEQFSLHIKGLADSLQIGSIDRISIEQYYLSLVLRYSKDFAPSNKITSEVVVKSNLVDYIYSDEFLEKFNEAYEEVIRDRRNIIPVFETLYVGLKEPFSIVEVSTESEFIPELKRRYVRLAVLVQKNEKAIADAKAKLEEQLKEKQNIESRLSEAKSRTNNVLQEVLPSVYTKLETYIAGIQTKITQFDEELGKLSEQRKEVKAQFLPFGNEIKLDKIQKQQDLILRKKITEKKKLEEAKAIIEFDRNGKTEEEIMIWFSRASLVENAIQAEILQCERAKREYQQLLQKYSDIELQILDATNAVEKAESEKYPEDVYKTINYLNCKLDNFSDYGVFKEVFNLAIKDFAKKNKVKIPNGMHRYDLYISLWFCIKYFGRRVGSSKFICFDEGQDLAFNEYKLIYSLNEKDIIYNIFGDTNQLLKPGRGILSWERLESTFFMEMFYLNENYRNTNQITRFCNQSFGMNVKETGVDGAKVREIPRKELEKELTNLNITTERIAILVSRKVIKKNYLEKEILSERIKSVISDKVDNGYIFFMYVDEVKGIEFDKVFVVSNRMTANERYIAYTRALSELIIVVDENIPDVDDTESEKTEIGEFVDHLRKGNMKHAKALYKQISDEWNEKQKISFFAHLFTRVNQYDKVLKLMGLMLPSLEINYIYNRLSVEQVDSIKKKVYGKKLQELLQTVYEGNNIEGFAGIVGCMDVWNKIEFVPKDNRRDLYLMANIRNAGRMWIDSISGEEIADFEKIMCARLELMNPKIAFDICTYAWKNTKISRKQIVSVIEQFSRRNAKGKQEYSCPFDVLLSLATVSGEEWKLVKGLVEKCSSKKFSFNKIKRYPQKELPEKIISYMEKLSDSNLSLEQKIFMYMNTSLREEAQIDKFFVMLKERGGVSIEACLSEMDKYWLVGKIRYLTEDGFVRIVPHNITSTKLVCFWSSNIHILGKDRVWVEPKIGDQIYFLLRRYDEEKNLFTIHYPCIEPMKINE